MTPLDTLAPDQRAVLELVLRQGRSYGELSELLGDPRARRPRARRRRRCARWPARPAAGVDSGRIADWLLGQQPDAEAERTRAAVARSEPSRDVGRRRRGEPARARRLRGAGRARRGRRAGAAAPRPRPLRDGAAEPPRPRDSAAPRAKSPVPRSSRLGGAILIGVARGRRRGPDRLLRDERRRRQPGGVDRQPPAATATPTATGHAAATPTTSCCRGPTARRPAGLMRLIPGNDGKVQFAIAAAERAAEQGQARSTRCGSPARACKPRRLGFAQSPVGKDGVLTTGGPQQGDEDEFPSWFATYDKVLVTRETDAKATTARPGDPRRARCRTAPDAGADRRPEPHDRPDIDDPGAAAGRGAARRAPSRSRPAARA